MDELRQRLADGEALTVLDVRDRDAFETWHVPGSVNEPVYEALLEGEEEALAGWSPSEEPVVTVCARGVMAARAAAMLEAEGVEATPLEGGLRAWTHAWNTAEIPLTTGEARLVQVRRTGKGCLSYVLGSGGEAIVVDPALDPDVYQKIADERGWTITHVLETHVHADHLSRARPLAEATGARHLLPEGAPVEFAHRAIADGDEIVVGDARIQAIATPGHTPESLTYRVGDEALLTGDTLFLEAVGRPDLEAGEGADQRARRLHASLARLQAMDADLRVLPAHADRPLGFDGEPHADRLGDVSDRIDVLALDEEAFVDTILDRVPETPPNHERIVEHNREGILPSGEATELEAGANRCAAG